MTINKVKEKQSTGQVSFTVQNTYDTLYNIHEYIKFDINSDSPRIWAAGIYISLDYFLINRVLRRRGLTVLTSPCNTQTKGNMDTRADIRGAHGPEGTPCCQPGGTTLKPKEIWIQGRI